MHRNFTHAIVILLFEKFLYSMVDVTLRNQTFPVQIPGLFQ
jgi:hypothetical protein